MSSIRTTMALVTGPHEVIVVDDASTDSTHQISQRMVARTLRVEHRRISAVRNACARAACGEILFFVDADTQVDELAVSAALKALRASDTGGGCVFDFDGPAPLWGHIILFFAGVLTMTGLQALILIMALALIPATEGQAAAESPLIKNGLIALTRRDPAGRLQIFTIHPDGTGKQRLTFQGDNGRPGWSPDGRKIAFGAHRGDKEFVPGSSHKTFVAVIDADGNNQKKVRDIDAFPFPGRASWQPGR